MFSMLTMNQILNGKFIGGGFETQNALIFEILGPEAKIARNKSPDNRKSGQETGKVFE